MIDRLATDTRIRVGLSATNFPWAAPSGIVDYPLREPKTTPSLTSILYTGPYDSRDIDLDGSELIDGQLGIAAAGSYHRDKYICRLARFGGDSVLRMPNARRHSI